MPLLYKIPQKLAFAVNSGDATLIGAIIKDTSTGKILGHVQQTSGFSNLLNHGLGFAGNFASGGSLLDAVTIVQNQQIKSSLTKLATEVNLIQHLQITNLAFGILNLGVSIASTVLILRSLEKIDNRLDKISQQIKQITQERREDELRDLIAEIKSDKKNIDMHHAKGSDSKSIVFSLTHNLSRSLYKLLEQLEKDLVQTQESSVPIEFIQYLWEKLALISLCQDSIIKAYFSIDELPFVVEFGSEQNARLLNLVSEINPNHISRIIAGRNPDFESQKILRKKANEEINVFTDALRGCIYSTLSQVSIAQTLLDQNASGNYYLREIEASNCNEPLFLPKRPWAINVI